MLLEADNFIDFHPEMYQRTFGRISSIPTNRMIFSDTDKVVFCQFQPVADQWYTLVSLRITSSLYVPQLHSYLIAKAHCFGNS